MGRKKGKQSMGLGKEFYSKSQHASYRNTIYVDHASEANKFRNPLLVADLGRGHGYRNAAPCDGGVGGSGCWHINGNGYGGADKWSTIFSSRQNRDRVNHHASTSVTSSNDAARSTAGLSHLRHLLEDRRSEDRTYDRQHRLRLQRSRISDAHDKGQTREDGAHNFNEERHEPGWLSSMEVSPESGQNQNGSHSSAANATEDSTQQNEIPTLQNLASRVLGPMLPMYCAAIGSGFVGESLKSVNSDTLSDIAISLARSNCFSRSDGSTGMFATTDGAVKALANSGLATGLVLRGAPIYQTNRDATEGGDIVDADTRWLSQDGILSLCPRILPDDDSSVDDGSHEKSCDHWETVDFDAGLNSRMSGCFHLKRLELIDVPLQLHGPFSPGFCLRTLRTVLQSCPGITHLSLSGCFYNWENTKSATSPLDEANDINMLLCGNQRLSSLVQTIKAVGRLNGNEEKAMRFIPQLLFHQTFLDDADARVEIPSLASLLPELKVLDISHCSWATPAMIVQFVLKLWDNAFASTMGIPDSRSSESRWEGGGGGEAISSEGKSDDDESSSGGNKLPHATSTTPSLSHLNIRGCLALLQAPTALPTWMDEWRDFGLFNGIELSIERQVGRKALT